MIDRKAFERKEIANAQLTEASAIALDTFKDPYLFGPLTGTVGEAHVLASNIASQGVSLPHRIAIISFVFYCIYMHLD